MKFSQADLTDLFDGVDARLVCLVGTDMHVQVHVVAYDSGWRIHDAREVYFEQGRIIMVTILPRTRAWIRIERWLERGAFYWSDPLKYSVGVIDAVSSRTAA